MSGHVKVGGAWKTVSSVSAKVGGAWKNVASAYTKIGGVWKQWYSSAAPPAYELIATAAPGGALSFTFSSIPQDYKHIQIRGVAKSAGSATGVSINFYNGAVVGTRQHIMTGNGSTVAVVGVNSSSSPTFTLSLASTSSTANSFTASIMDILDYSSTVKTKVARIFYGKKDEINAVTFADSYYYNSTAPLTGISFTSTVIFDSATRFSLYGIRG